MSETNAREGTIRQALIDVGVDDEIASRTAISLAEQQSSRDLLRQIFGDKPAGHNPFTRRH